MLREFSRRSERSTNGYVVHLSWRRRSSGRHLRRLQQLFKSRKFYGLDDVEVEPCFLRTAPILSLPPASLCNKDHVPTPRLLTNTSGDIVAVQFWKADV